MNSSKPIGIYLFKKPTQDSSALKELLQFVRSSMPGKGHSFSYIEARSSLHPNLSLLENLKIEIGFNHSKEFYSTLKPEWSSLVKLLQRPDIKTSEAQCWEKFIISLLKGLMIPSKNLIIDINEDLLSPFLIMHLKNSILNSTNEKNVILASANSSLWLDCAHTLVNRHDFKFEMQKMDPVNLKKSWVA